MTTIPTTQSLVDRNVSAFESRLGQDVPLQDKAFLRVLAVLEAIGEASAYRFSTEQIKQNLAITATGDDLERIGADIGIIRKPAEAAELRITMPATTGADLSPSIGFVGDSNGVRYYHAAFASEAGGIIEVVVTAEDEGAVGNLQVSDTMTIISQVAGVGSTATVTVVENIGADKEDQEVYRRRVLFRQAAVAGGGDAASYKEWGEEVAGVETIYPYAGKPYGSVDPSFPGDRTLYVEATTDVDPDGIAPQALLDEVKEQVQIPDDTDRERPPLGLEDSNLYVESISRISIYVVVIDLVITADLLSRAKSDIEDALTTYFLAIAPFVEGVDAPQSRNDKITTPTVTSIVQDVLTALGGTSTGVTFSLSSGGAVIDEHVLVPGVKAKLGAVAYA